MSSEALDNGSFFSEMKILQGHAAYPLSHKANDEQDAKQQQQHEQAKQRPVAHIQHPSIIMLCRSPSMSSSCNGDWLFDFIDRADGNGNNKNNKNGISNMAGAMTSTDTSETASSSDSDSSSSSSLADVGGEDQSTHNRGSSSSSSFIEPTTTTTAQASVNPFVDVIMIVDPSTHRALCPRQVLSYLVPTSKGGYKTEKAVFGPLVLDGTISDDTIRSLRNKTAAFGNNGSVMTAASQQQEPRNNTVHNVVAPTPQRAVLSPSVVPNSMPKQQQQAFRGVSGTAASAQQLPPMKALSAYNFFFRDERDRIVNDDDSSSSEIDLTKARQDAILSKHWNRDRTAKRRHRKTHGKIDFATLSRRISKKWKTLPQAQQDFYREVARRDWNRYQNELEEYKTARDAAVPEAPTSSATSTTTAASSLFLPSAFTIATASSTGLSGFYSSFQPVVG